MKKFIFNSIFFKVEDMLDFILEKDILSSSKACLECSGLMSLQIRGETLIYRCSNRNCRKRKSLMDFRLSICEISHIIYLIMTDCTWKQLKRYKDISNGTIMKIKKKLRSAYDIYLKRNPVYLGGLGKIVEIDESVLSRRQIIRNPTSTDDDYLDTIWILGAIDNTNEKNFMIKRVENRKVETLTRELGGKILIGTTVCTDGYISYPQTCRYLGLPHKIVNHSQGFINDEGIHTNNIEGFWSHLKSQMRKENGVKRENLDIWLTEYEFKRRFLINAEDDEVIEKFIEIMKIILNI